MRLKRLGLLRCGLIIDLKFSFFIVITGNFERLKSFMIKINMVLLLLVMRKKSKKERKSTILL